MPKVNAPMRGKYRFDHRACAFRGFDLSIGSLIGHLCAEVSEFRLGAKTSDTIAGMTYHLLADGSMAIGVKTISPLADLIQFSGAETSTFALSLGGQPEFQQSVIIGANELGISLEETATITARKAILADYAGMTLADLAGRTLYELSYV